MAGIISRKFEVTLCKVAAHAAFNLNRLDLSIPEASQLKKMITDVVTQYGVDFPPKQAAPEVEVASELAPPPPVADDSAKVSLVQMEDTLLTDVQYREEQAMYEVAVQSHRKRALDNYINTNAALVIDDGSDIERRKRKLISLPVAAEKKGSCL